MAIYRICLIAILFSLSLINPASAMDPWTGEKLIHSVTSKGMYFISIDMQNNGEGVITTDSGQGTFTFAKSGDDKISLTMTTEISNQSYVYLVNKKACQQDPNSCIPELVEQKSTLQAMTLSGETIGSSAFPVEVSETWKRCAAFVTNSDPATYEECETSTVNLDMNLLAESTLSTSPITAEAGDKVFLTLPGDQRAYLKLNDDNTVAVLAGHISEKPANFDVATLADWALTAGNLIFTTTTGGTLTYSQTQTYDGIARIAGRYQVGGEQQTFAGAMKVDKELDTSNQTMADVAGFYKTISADTRAFLDVDYFFNIDGMGGYTFKSGLSVSGGTMGWSWTLDSGKMVATQYKYLPGQGNGLVIVNDEADIKACVASLNTPNPVCTPRMVRSYQLIDQDGNQHTMLRTLDFYGSSDPTKVTDRSLSVWVFFKK